MTMFDAPPDYEPSDLEKDLHERWLPSADQRKRAEAMLRGYSAPGDSVWTAHLLLHKTYGFWTKDVALVHLDGVFTDRAPCLEYLVMMARTHHDETGVRLTGGYSIHHLDKEGNEQAAVFEDIMARHPKD